MLSSRGDISRTDRLAARAKRLELQRKTANAAIDSCSNCQGSGRGRSRQLTNHTHTHTHRYVTRYFFAQHVYSVAKLRFELGAR